MPFDDRALRERDLVDQVSLVFEHSGLPPIAGRIYARLLFCDPPEQSSQDLADYLAASKGAVSTMTRQLMQMGLVERVRVRGSRASWFRCKPGAWTELMHAEMLRFTHLRRLAAEGLELLADSSTESRKRLQEFHDLNAFFEQEFPDVLARWDALQEETK